MSNYIDETCPEDWRKEALCRGKKAELWYPPLIGNRNAYVPFGRLVCQQCPVWKCCLESGKNEDFGLWGGLTARERNGAPLDHGSWVHYRQGCRCQDCYDDEHGFKRPINLDMIPNIGEKLPTPDHLRKSVYSLS